MTAIAMHYCYWQLLYSLLQFKTATAALLQSTIYHALLQLLTFVLLSLTILYALMQLTTYDTIIKHYSFYPTYESDIVTCRATIAIQNAEYVIRLF